MIKNDSFVLKEEYMKNKEYLNQEILFLKLYVKFVRDDKYKTKGVQFYYQSSKKDKGGNPILYEICDTCFRKVDNEKEYVYTYKVCYSKDYTLSYAIDYNKCCPIYEKILENDNNFKFSMNSYLCDKLLGKNEKPLVRVKDILKVKKILNSAIKYKIKTIDKDLLEEERKKILREKHDKNKFMKLQKQQKKEDMEEEKRKIFEEKQKQIEIENKKREKEQLEKRVKEIQQKVEDFESNYLS